MILPACTNLSMSSAIEMMTKWEDVIQWSAFGQNLQLPVDIRA